MYYISDKVKSRKDAKPRLRFKSEEEREAHKLSMSKRKHRRNFNENFRPTSLYSTLTFDNENEVHTWSEANYIKELYLRRLRYAYPEAVIFFYKGRGKSTHRIHFHMVSEGISEELIRKQWIYGEVVEVNHLREHNYYQGVDHGQDYTGLADYLFDHWTPEQGGKRWYQTRNARRPEREEPKEIKRAYSEDKPPTPPKGYKMVESRGTKYGYMYFKYVLDIEPEKKKVKKNTTDTS